MQPIKQAIFLMGPTASGKTDLALKLAAQLPVNIISVDSVMIYKGMDIGTGKPDKATLTQVPHALIDILDPAQSYSVALFCKQALALMQQSAAQQRIPLLVGGTMMYYHALLHGISDLPSADPVVREQLLEQAKQYGWQHLHQQLQELDPITAAKIHPNDPQRLQRALEVIAVTGLPVSDQLQDNQQFLQGWQILKFAIAPQDRALLHQKIAQRFHNMLAAGLLEEVQRLRQRPDLHLALPALRAVGYKQIWQYLSGDYTEQQMIERAIIATRQLAKRQFTWLRRYHDLHWLDSESSNLVADILAVIG